MIRTARLGDFVRIRTGKLDANASVPNGEYPFFTCAIEPLRIDRFSYDCECILIAGNGDLNVKYFNGKFEAYQRTYIVESIDKSRLFPRFLFHFMCKYIEKLRRMSIGGVIKYIKLDYLTEVEIPHLDFDEQRRIADVLDRAEALRAKRRAALAELDGLAQSIFIEMFGPPTRIMSSWPTQSLGTLLRFLTSGSRGWAEYYSETGDLFLRIQNVKNDELSLNEVAFVKPPDTAEANRTKVNAGDVLLSITADIGRTAVVPNAIEKAFISQHLALLRTDGISPRFLSAYLSSESGQEQIFKRNKQGVKAGLNFDDIRSFIIPLPPNNLQQEFARRVAVVEKLKAVQRASLAELDALFASLQDRAFRGAL